MIIDDIRDAIGKARAEPASHRLEMGVGAKRALAANLDMSAMPRWFDGFRIRYVRHAGWDLVPLRDALPVDPTGPADIVANANGVVRPIVVPRTRRA